MTPYERGYTDTMEKLAKGMFPSIKRLFQMGVKPGSGVSLMPYARKMPKGPPAGAMEATSVGRNLGLRGTDATLAGTRMLHGDAAATAVGKRMRGTGTRPTLTPAEMRAETLISRRPAMVPPAPPRMMPDVREILRQRAQQAGTYVAL